MTSLNSLTRQRALPPHDVVLDVADCASMRALLLSPDRKGLVQRAEEPKHPKPSEVRKCRKWMKIAVGLRGFFWDVNLRQE